MGCWSPPPTHTHTHWSDRRARLACPEEPVAIRRSDTGLIGALLNQRGGEETPRRTPGWLYANHVGLK